MNQHEITERRPLLDASGNLTEPGYAKSLLPVYRRGDIKANKLRIKEWDYYCINNGHFALALTIADNSYMGLDSISLLNLDEGWEITKSPMKAFTNGKVCLPESSERGDVHSAGRNYSILFKNEGDRRVLIAQMKNFGPEGSLYAKVTLTDIPAESMVIATPFDKDKHFYYNQKINCMRAEGAVTYGYHNRTYTFDPADSFAVLDWGPTFLQESRGLSSSMAGWTVAIFEVCGITGMLLAGWISDKFFGGRAQRTCVFCMAGVILFISLFFALPESTDPVVLLMMLAVAGFFIYGPQALIGVIASNHATKKAASTANGVVGMVSYVSVVVSGWGFGFISDHFGWRWVFITMIAMAVLGFLVLLSMWNTKSDGYEHDAAETN